MKKIRVGLLFGGRSVEHEVSLLSAKSVLSCIDKDKYEVVLIGIDKNGQWHLRDEKTFAMTPKHPREMYLDGEKREILLTSNESGKLVSLTHPTQIDTIDVIFPLLHGTYGEDGTVQGSLKLAGIPFVGAGVLSSAIGMDKDIMKRLWRDAMLPVTRFITLESHQLKEIDSARIIKKFGLPLFVKPSNLGSSIGVVKVKKEEDFLPALEHAFQYDHKILIEEYVIGREIECAVIGNEEPIASLPGEVIPKGEFHSYEAKYVDDMAVFLIPAPLSPDLVRTIQTLAIKAYQTLSCSGMARVDFFLTPDHHVILNEINTIPGFTKLSMFPRVWEASGIPMKELIDRLITLAIDRFEKEKILRTQI